MTANKGKLPVMDRSRPSAGAQPFGAKSPANAMTSPRYVLDRSTEPEPGCDGKTPSVAIRNVSPSDGSRLSIG